MLSNHAPEYACVIWSPYNSALIEQLESIQCLPACFIFNDYNHYSSVTNILMKLEWSTLKQPRTKHHAIIMFKINYMIDIPPKPPIFTIQIEVTIANLSNSWPELIHILILSSLMQFEFGILYLYHWLNVPQLTNLSNSYNCIIYN